MSRASSTKEDFKEEEVDYTGYRKYKKLINPDKLMGISYNFDPMKLAIDTLFK